MTKSIAAAHQQLKSSPRCTTKESCADKIKLILIGSNACINLWIIMFNSSASLLAGVVGKYCIITDCCLFFFQLRGVRITSATTANISLTSKGWSCLIEVAVHFAVSAKCISDTLQCTHSCRWCGRRRSIRSLSRPDRRECQFRDGKVTDSAPAIVWALLLRLPALSHSRGSI